MARFRNRLVHLYWEVDDQQVYHILTHDLDDFDAFVAYILHLSGHHLTEPGSASIGFHWRFPFSNPLFAPPGPSPPKPAKTMSAASTGRR